MSSSDRSYWSFFSAGRIVFGSGSARSLGELIRPWRSTRALIVADQALVRAGIVAKATAPLLESGLTVDVFDGGQPEPSFAVAEQALAFARDAHPDVLIGLGGGSNMDLAKVVATILSHGGNFRDYAGFGNVPGPVLPVCGGRRAKARVVSAWPIAIPRRRSWPVDTWPLGRAPKRSVPP